MSNFLFSTVTADGLAPSGARPSAGTSENQVPILYTYGTGPGLRPRTFSVVTPNADSSFYT